MKDKRILKELALRAPIEVMGSDVNDGIECVKYRFDTRQIGGDYTIIRVPSKFADEKTARFVLYCELLKWF